MSIIETANSISSPLALLSLALILGAWIYKKTLRHEEEVLKSLPESERDRHFDKYLTRYKIDGKKLPQKDILKLILAEMNNRQELLKYSMFTLSVVFVSCFYLTVTKYPDQKPEFGASGGNLVHVGIVDGKVTGEFNNDSTNMNASTTMNVDHVTPNGQADFRFNGTSKGN